MWDEGLIVSQCAPGYSGKRCEYLTSLSFTHNSSYVELEPLHMVNTLEKYLNLKKLKIVLNKFEYTVRSVSGKQFF